MPVTLALDAIHVALSFDPAMIVGLLAKGFCALVPFC